MIVCRNGVRQVETGHFEGHRPENYARRHIGAAFDPAATCKRFEALLWDMLGRVDLMDLVQEMARRRVVDRLAKSRKSGAP